MKHEEKTSLDHLLKTLDEDVVWHSERQQQTREKLYATFNRVNYKNTSRIKRIKNLILPVVATLFLLGILTTLILNKIVDENYLSTKDTEETAESPSTLSNNNHEIQISNDDQNEIKQIKASDFDLRLPSYSPKAPTEVKGITKRSAGLGFSVTALYYHNDEKLFNFMQESLVDSKKSMFDYPNNGIENIKETANRMIEVNGKDGYITIKGSETHPLLIINIIMKNNVFTISSYQLTEDELIEVAESIDLSNL